MSTDPGGSLSLEAPKYSGSRRGDIQELAPGPGPDDQEDAGGAWGRGLPPDWWFMVCNYDQRIEVITEDGGHLRHIKFIKEMHPSYSRKFGLFLKMVFNNLISSQSLCDPINFQ